MPAAISYSATPVPVSSAYSQSHAYDPYRAPEPFQAPEHDRMQSQWQHQHQHQEVPHGLTYDELRAQEQYASLRYEQELQRSRLRQLQLQQGDAFYEHRGMHDYVDDPQNEFQLGDEACNVAANWQDSAALEHLQETSETQFISLLGSLEARVDLMSQMQQTRVALQKRTKEANGDDWGESRSHASGFQASLAGSRSPVQEVSVAQVLPEDHGHDDLRATVKGQQDHIERLNREVESMRQQMSSFGTSSVSSQVARVTAPVAESLVHEPESLDVTRPVPMLPLPVVPEPPEDFDGAAVLLPFCPQACGVNLELSEDGYTATRTRGCRQSVAIGTAPLAMQELGRYFEVVVEDTVAGWVGGLGIGVTASNPVGLKRVPDKAWRVPSTSVVGYWGCVFLDGTEHRTEWRSDNLRPGSRVGLLVTKASGDIIVFADGEPVVKIEAAIPCTGKGVSTEPLLYPVVDVFAATRVVTLLASATPPSPPWESVHSPIAAKAAKQEGGGGQGMAAVELFKHDS